MEFAASPHGQCSAHEGCGARLFAFAIRIVLSGRSGWRRARGAGGDRRRPHSDRVVCGRHWSLRPLIPSFDVNERSDSVPSCYTWEDTEGRAHQILQHERAIRSTMPSRR